METENIMKFEEIEIGEIFEVDGIEYVKVPQINYKKHGDIYNAINISNRNEKLFRFVYCLTKVKWVEGVEND